MPLRLQRLISRLFPQGPVDVLRQIAIFATAYYAYRLTRGYIDDPQGAAIAFDNARDLVAIEQSMGLFVERAIQDFTLQSGFFTDVASWIYINAQTSVVLGAIVFMYLFHNERYYFVRNMFVVAMGIALVGYVLFPTAPPRFFFPEYGFVDTVSEFTGVSHDDVKVNALFNPYAAVPSMHCAFAIMIGVPLFRVIKSPIRWFWAIYPLIMTWVVVATGNHWWLDAFLGLVTAAVSAYAADWLARARPAVWAFSPARA